MTHTVWVIPNLNVIDNHKLWPNNDLKHIANLIPNPNLLPNPVLVPHPGFDQFRTTKNDRYESKGKFLNFQYNFKIRV